MLDAIGDALKPCSPALRAFPLKGLADGLALTGGLAIVIMAGWTIDATVDVYSRGTTFFWGDV